MANICSNLDSLQNPCLLHLCCSYHFHANRLSFLPFYCPEVLGAISFETLIRGIHSRKCSAGLDPVNFERNRASPKAFRKLGRDSEPLQVISVSCAWGRPVSLR